MKFSMAEFLGMITLLTVTFAAFRFLFGSPTAIGAIVICSVPIHRIVCELVEKMSSKSQRPDRIV